MLHLRGTASAKHSQPSPAMLAPVSLAHTSRPGLIWRRASAEDLSRTARPFGSPGCLRLRLRLHRRVSLKVTRLSNRHLQTYEYCKRPAIER